MPLHISIGTKKKDTQLPGREAETIAALLETRYDAFVMGVTILEQVHGTHIMTTAKARELASQLSTWARSHFSDLDIDVQFEGEVS